MESVAYIISLDAIDLNLLYNSYKPRQNKAPLWSVNPKDLWEFQMHIRESSPEQQCVKKSESTILHKKMESVICHICNTSVPKQFLKEHNESSKHKIYMEIAQTALKRIRKRVNDENNNETIELNESDYFCPHCVSVMNIKEKKTHEGSLNHKNSVFLDKQLSEFLNVYSNDIEKSDNNNENNTTDIVHEGSNETIVSNETSKKTKFKDAITSLDLKKYLNILKDKYNMTLNAKNINKGWLEIEVEGSTVEVAAENFYGLKEDISSSSIIECVICSEYVKYEDIVAHIMRAKHMYGVSRPMNDIHCKREIYALWHHCVLCNIIITNYKTHTLSDVDHKKWLKESLKSDLAKSVDNSIVAPKNVTLVSETESNKTDVRAHLLGYVTSKYKYLFKIETGRLWCMVCDVAINETDSLETHTYLDDHIKKYVELLITNKLQIQYNNDFFCKLCNEVVLSNKELLHVNDSCHMRQLQVSENRKKQTNTSSYYCNVCGVNVPNRVHNIQIHNRGKNHLKNKAKSISTKKFCMNETR